MLAVIGSFRFPADKVDAARPAMETVIRAFLQEPGCRAYSYAQDVRDPGLFRVLELWDNRAALDAHFVTPHMRNWAATRAALGFHDRRITVHDIGEGEAL